VLLALTNALSQQRLHHAYLFTGTRGVGKTSLARLFAKGLNCEQGVTATPCGVCSSCEEIAQGRFVDLIEVDAASRTKVDDTRELLDNVQYRPSRGRYKVYLIDEVHMLSRSSFNALLKTLEEPPEHVKFLLATTDPQKLPVTVLSRCLQFNLKSLSQDEIAKQLEFVLTQEQLPFENQALALLAKAANGSMRDALSLTDQAIAFGSGQVMHQQVQSMLGSIDQQQVIALLKALCDADIEPLMTTVAKVLAFGADAQEVLRSLLELLHQITLTQFAPAAAQSSLYSEQILAFAQQISAEQIQLYYQMLLAGRKDLPFAPDPKSGLEMALLRAVAFVPEKQTKRWITDNPVNLELPPLGAKSQEVIETRPKSPTNDVTHDISVDIAGHKHAVSNAFDAEVEPKNSTSSAVKSESVSKLANESSLAFTEVNSAADSDSDSEADNTDDFVDIEDDSAQLIAQQAMLLNQAESMGFTDPVRARAVDSDNTEVNKPNEGNDTQSLTPQVTAPQADINLAIAEDSSSFAAQDDVYIGADYAQYEEDNHTDYEDYLAYNQQSETSFQATSAVKDDSSQLNPEPLTSHDLTSTIEPADEAEFDPLDDILDLVLASRDTLLAEVSAHKAQDEADASNKKAADKQQAKISASQAKLGGVNTVDVTSDEKSHTAQPPRVKDSAQHSSSIIEQDVSTEKQFSGAYDRPPWEAPSAEELALNAVQQVATAEIAPAELAVASHIATPTLISHEVEEAEATGLIEQGDNQVYSKANITELSAIGHEITGNEVDLHWYQIMAQVKVGGRVRQLGVNSLCQSVSNPITLTLKPDQKHLCADIAIEQLQAGLSAFLEQDIQVIVDIGQDASRETPLELRKRFHKELVQQAKQSILADEHVQWMINELAAQLDDDSVVYPQEQLTNVAQLIPALLD
jgi:DNA polymerase-3 subunit gamma/tau